jgi:adenosylcobyric acid synthase
MVLGCTSMAGKSLLVTGLARWFARQGVDVVPFKAQNMSNNARVVDGGEIGVAQWLQAAAAGVEPDVRMNPVLLKPEGETRSQVVVLGEARLELADVPWKERGPLVWPAIEESFDSLRREHELVVIEGAGSPAEINLPDLVNNRTVAHADAAALLVVDIDRGGAFAHVVGTWMLVPDATRARLRGFVLNKLRGDASLLAPGPEIVAARTRMPCLGVLPMLRHELPDEEGATVRTVPPTPAPRVAVVAFPFASNLDEFHVLARAAVVEYVREPTGVEAADVVILPGSKHVAADLAWMHQRGLGDAVRAAAHRGTRVVAICGGAMMLATEIRDPLGIEGGAPGLALLPLTVTMGPDKIVRRTSLRFGSLPAPWSRLEGISSAGYEIRHGRVDADRDVVTADDCVWADGPILATTVHGLFEDADVVDAIVGRRPSTTLDVTFDLLAGAIEEHLDTQRIWELVRG